MCVGMKCARVTPLTTLEMYMMLGNIVQCVLATSLHHPLEVDDTIMYSNLFLFQRGIVQAQICIQNGVET